MLRGNPNRTFGRRRQIEEPAFAGAALVAGRKKCQAQYCEKGQVLLFQPLQFSVPTLSAGEHPVVPDFRRVLNLAATARADSLANLPMPWYQYFGAPAQSRAIQSETGRTRAGTTLARSPGLEP